ncbi:MAG: general secretion pathway protein J [Patiriisocius sp.]|jgi:general secretion pathway protein J
MIKRHLNVTKKNLDCLNFNFPDINQRGFTLLEIVIAIAIFSLLALGANSLLTTVTRSSEISAQREANFEQLQRAMLIIERDFLQIQDRVPRTQGLDNNLRISGGEFEFESDAYGIGFVRGGWRNPQLRLKRSSLQNVAYRLQENRLERLHTNYVDAVLGTQPNIRVLLDDVTDFKVEVLREIKAELEWSDTIPDVELPHAIAVIITTEAFGVIRREFRVKV